MNKLKIGYNHKSTKSNNTYISINKQDNDTFYKNVQAINAYMQELALSTDPDIKEFIKWWRGSDKKYPYNKRLGKYNTPETMMAGLINNVLYGNQRDLSVEQLPFYEEITNICAEVIEELIMVKKLDLQPDYDIIGVQFGLEF